MKRATLHPTKEPRRPSRRNPLWCVLFALVLVWPAFPLGPEGPTVAAAPAPLEAMNAAAGLAQVPEASVPDEALTHPDNVAGVPGTSQDWWSAVQAQIQEDMYDLVPEDGPEGLASFAGQNLAHGWDVNLAPDGVRLAPAQSVPDPMEEQPARAEESWSWGLRLTGYGYEGAVQPPAAAAEVVAGDNRVEFRRDGLVVWYVNEERGLEQGFVLEEAPYARTPRPLVLEMALEGDLVPRLWPDGQTIDFTLPGGGASLLRYEGLLVTDAEGREVPAHLAVSDGRVSIVIDDSSATYPLTVDPWAVTPDWTAFMDHGTFGHAVDSAGDVNGDGYDDLVVGAWGWDGSKGRAYLFYGSAAGLSTSPDWQLDGQNSPDNYGRAVASAGDLNGDGYDDVVIGAPNYGDGDGKVYVYYGAAEGLGTSATSMTESADSFYGWAVETAGDVNGDGFDDVIVGAYRYSSSYGRAYVYHGSELGLHTDPDWTVTGGQYDHLGYDVDTAGDVNGDGYDDVLIGAYRHESYTGAALVYYGSELGVVNTDFWQVTGEEEDDRFGYTVSSAGDVNGDGHDDVIIGAYGAAGDRGRVYAYYGTQGGLTYTPNWTSVGDAAPDATGAIGGIGLSTAGDLNADGYDDVIVGAPGYDDGRGRVSVYHGTEDGLELATAWTTVGDLDMYYGRFVGTAGDVNNDGYDDLWISASFYGYVFVMHGSATGLRGAPAWTSLGENGDDAFAWSLGAAGDVDGDGYGDLIVGAPGYGVEMGIAYVFLGTAGGPSETPGWAVQGQNPGDSFGGSVGAAGDVNGDGYDDVIVGAPGHDLGTGAAYVYYGSASGVENVAAWSANGKNSGDAFGSAVGTVGDVDGDGYDEVFAGAYGAPRGNSYGKVYLYHGSESGPSPGEADWVAGGENAGDRFGWSAGTAGDANADGYADLVVGAYGYEDGKGKAYVYLGSSEGLTSGEADWSRFGGAAGDRYGWSVSTAGDVNGDGYADVVVGAEGWDGDQGRVYVYHGEVGGLASYQNWTKFGAHNESERFGSAVSTAGDVNGDGYADIVVGSRGYNSYTGEVFVYNGSPTGLEDTSYWRVWRVSGQKTGDRLGSAVGTGGDVNGDGYADIVAGAWGYDHAAAGNVGRAYLYQGTGRSLAEDAAARIDGENDFDWYASDSDVATAGDVNGDGYSDVVVGAWGHGGGRGKAYVYHGSAAGLQTTAAWSQTGEAGGDRYGRSVGAAGDVNGDGYGDVVVGAFAHNSERGKAYVYYGSATGLSSDAVWSKVGDGTSDRYGMAVAGVGDVNGDGYGDLAIAAPYQGGGSISVYVGQVYLYYGSALGPSSSPDWIDRGRWTTDLFGHDLGPAGDVNGDGYADLVVGAPRYYFERGQVRVYHGGAEGLSETADWTADGESNDLRFGWAVGTAGDVNGDGYSDVAASTPYYDGSKGRVSVYHGSAAGLDVPISEYYGEEPGDRFGWSVTTAGDVNGDGYADLVVGADSHDSMAGRVYVYHGSATGLGWSPAWTKSVDGTTWFGRPVSTAGDVNGDGFADIVVGSSDIAERGAIHIYQGGEGGGRLVNARQVRADGSALPVQPWGVSYTHTEIAVAMQATHPLGHGLTKLQVQACPPGAPFGDESCVDHISDDWREASGPQGTTLSTTVYGLERGRLYRWRARVVYDTPLYTHGPWRRLQAQGQEADVRSMEQPTDLSIEKSVDPPTPIVGQPITYTLAYWAATGPAKGVVITDILPSDITNVTVMTTGLPISDTGASPGYVWYVGDMEAGEGGSIIISGVAGSARFINTAVITTTSIELNPADNTSTVQTHIMGIIFVDQEADGLVEDGLTWATAYTRLQDALAAADSGDEIWVTEGVYRPTDELSRTASFELVDGVGVYGGFAGDEVWRHERDWVDHPTVLSGDIGTQNNPDDNVYHVVTANNDVGPSAVLDGFAITGGSASDTGTEALGGGLYNEGASPTLYNLTISGNRADRGGGLCNAAGSVPLLVDVVLSGNEALSQGGAIYNAGDSSPTLLNVTLSGNTAGTQGGGMANETGTATVRNSIVWGNSPDQFWQDGSGQIDASFCDVEGGWSGAGNLDGDPSFYDADGADDTVGTLDDDLRLRHDSAAIDLGDDGAVPVDSYDLDGDDDTAESLPLDLSGRQRTIGFRTLTPRVDMGAYEANILDAIAEAQEKQVQGTSFRMEQLQLLPADTMAEALQNYQDYNDGEMFYDFCADYGAIGADGYCPDDPERKNVRNMLLDAVGLYLVALNYPSPDFITHDGDVIPVAAIGASGVVSSAHEIANVHLIFGNEFLIDAIDYRFSLEGIPYADQIIQKELEELALAKLQFVLTVDLLFRLLDADEWDVSQYLSSDDFEIFGVASNRMMIALEEMAARYHMQGDAQAALAIFDQAYEEQYMQLTALAQMAEEVGAEYLQNGSWEMLNTLSQMRDRAQAIRDGLDFFGFAPDYVPLQSYERLLTLSEGPTGDTGLMGTARDLEDQAREAQRTFDKNASDMATEQSKLVILYNDQLFGLCGESEDADGDGLNDYDPCEGGLIERNHYDLNLAAYRVSLAWQKAQNLTERILIEQEKTDQIIRVNLALAGEISAIDLAVGKLNATKETYTSVSSSEMSLYDGVKVGVETFGGWEVTLGTGESKAEVKFGQKGTFDVFAGFQATFSWVDSTVTTWSPNDWQIAQYQSYKTLQQAEASAEILGASSAATIRNLLLQQSEALIDYEIAVESFNKLAAEHNHLVQKHSRLLNKRAQAQNLVVQWNSHLLSPAYRIMRDSLTVQSAGAINLAAQFAYLTAKAAEYDLLTPYPGLTKIYSTRTSNDIRLFLNDLAVWHQALDLPGQLNRYPYILSIARDVLGWSDEDLDPDGKKTPDQIYKLRSQKFRQYLRDHQYDHGLEFSFATALNQGRPGGQYLFSPNIWNNRIAGIGAPLAQNEGLRVNIVTRQSHDVGALEVVLVHDGQTSYRNAAGELVNLDPDTAVPVGYVLPAELDPESTTVVLRPAINGQGGTANSGLINLSVAASDWTLFIPPDSMGDLDLNKIDDIEIRVDTTGRALPTRQAQAAEDARRLQAGLAMEPVSGALPLRPAAGWPQRLQLAAPATLAPSVPGTVGGSYFGNVMVTSPLTVAVQVLHMDLFNDGGTLSGRVNPTETALYHGEIALEGTTDGATFVLTSAVMTSTVLGREVQRQFWLAGDVLENGDVVSATYTSIITGLLPNPVVEQGRFRASRPATIGSLRVSLEAADWLLPLDASTAITATLYNEAMEPITGTQHITFTASLGTVDPATVETATGVATTTFTAGDVEGQAVVTATTGLLTRTVSINLTRHGMLDGVLYVTHDGSGDCFSWDTACGLQDALATAVEGDEIWVAEETYYPGPSRTDTFELRSEVEIYGGFTITMTSRAERDWESHRTTLSGDIGTPADESDNSYRVVTSSGAGATAILDGFTVTAGNADGAGPLSQGGGLYNAGGSPTLRNVTFSDNEAEQGGGIYSSGGSPTLENVTFQDNEAEQGGGLCNDGSSPALTYVVFEDNTATLVGGGGMANLNGSAPHLTNVVLRGNVAWAGAGGAMHNQDSDPVLTNVLFVDNYAPVGGAMGNYGSQPALANVTLSGNTATTGGGIYSFNSTATIANSILWANSASSAGDQIYNDASVPVVRFSLVEGSGGSGAGWDVNLGTDGGDNLDADPQFKDAAGGDLRLGQASPAIDMADPVPTSCPATDLRGLARDDLRCDMGAYEVTMADTDTIQRDGLLAGGLYSFGPTLARVKVTALGSLHSLIVQRVDGDHPYAIDTGVGTVGLGRYWTIDAANSQGGNADGFELVLTLPALLVPDAQDTLCRYVGSKKTDWECASSSFHAEQRTITRDHVTRLSDWAVGDNFVPDSQLSSFTATAVHPGALLEWETVSEVDCVGFDLYRVQTQDEPLSKVNDALIPSQAPSDEEGARYQYLDGNVPPGGAYYWLEEVDPNGDAVRHGPIRFTQYAVYLPLVVRR